MSLLQKLRAPLSQTRSLRSYLIFSVVATLVPLVTFSFGVLAALLQRQRESLEQDLLATARLRAFVVQRELEGSIQPLEGLARSPSLATSDFQAFYREAQQVARGHPAWSTVILLHPDGRQILNV